jgi:hypothetical protein
MQLNVNNPVTVYICFTNEMPRLFNLYDASGDKYYFRYLDGKTQRIKFNIPDPGIYKGENFEVIKFVSIEIPTSFPRLPAPDRDRLKETTIKFNPHLNDTPCRIFTETGIIETGHFFYSLPKPIRLFLLLHEKGHFFYKDESNCDLYALINFIKMGYSRNMAYYALTTILKRSQSETKRMKNLLQYINTIPA